VDAESAVAVLVMGPRRREHLASHFLFGCCLVLIVVLTDVLWPAVEVLSQ
jgi:hypothetical protein